MLTLTVGIVSKDSSICSELFSWVVWTLAPVIARKLLQGVAHFCTQVIHHCRNEKVDAWFKKTVLFHFNTAISKRHHLSFCSICVMVLGLEFNLALSCWEFVYLSLTPCSKSPVLSTVQSKKCNLSNWYNMGHCCCFSVSQDLLLYVW